MSEQAVYADSELALTSETASAIGASGVGCAKPGTSPRVSRPHAKSARCWLASALVHLALFFWILAFPPVLGHVTPDASSRRILEITEFAAQPAPPVAANPLKVLLSPLAEEPRLEFEPIPFPLEAVSERVEARADGDAVDCSAVFPVPAGEGGGSEAGCDAGAPGPVGAGVWSSFHPAGRGRGPGTDGQGAGRPSGSSHSSRATLAGPPPAPRAVGPTRAARVIRERPPVFPERQRRAERAAVVELELSVDARGQPALSRVLTPKVPEDFIQAAVSAALAARYEPALEEGRPVESYVLRTFEFRLR